eukprot:9181870-Pyramimonas_sp.AAC.1
MLYSMFRRVACKYYLNAAGKNASTTFPVLGRDTVLKSPAALRNTHINASEHHASVSEQRRNVRSNRTRQTTERVTIASVSHRHSAACCLRTYPVREKSGAVSPTFTAARVVRRRRRGARTTSETFARSDAPRMVTLEVEAIDRVDAIVIAWMVSVDYRYGQSDKCKKPVLLVAIR